MVVVFATCDDRPLVAPDDEPLVEALRGLGVDVVPIPWTEIDPYGVADPLPIVLRSTWDYHRIPTMFAAWLEALDFSGRTVMNPAAIALQNIDKIYLRALGDAGVPIPKTRWIDRPDAAALKEILREEHWDAAVLKPRIGATAHGVVRLDPGTAIEDADLAPARSGGSEDPPRRALPGAFVQEFIPEILSRGEISLVFSGKDFSHAVVKHARDGDFRVQGDFGGTVAEATPSPAVSALAAQVMATVPDECCFARVDIVEAARGPLLLELELIEPELFFTIVPTAAATMASAIAARVA